jgi:hypothetical protein
MPSAKYSRPINEAGGPEEQAIAHDFDEVAALLVDLGIGELAGKAPSTGRASAPMSHEYDREDRLALHEVLDFLAQLQ